MDSLPVGSAAWIGGEAYFDSEEYSDRINQFIDKIDEGALVTFASGLRENRSCNISREFSVGSFHLVRKIQFDDGVEWIARLRMPPMPDEDGEIDTRESTLLGMQSELATMEFLREKTDIPIPKVYAYDLNDQNAVKCAFSIIEYVHGNTAQEMSRTYPGDHEGIPAQFEEKFWRQVATVMLQLASIRLPKIGSIFRDETNPGSFVVGPFIDTGSGPYDSAADFYADYPVALSKSLGRQPVGGQEELVQAFQSLAASFPPTTQTDSSASGFGLANYDLGPNNFLVDREFNVLAIIDWDTVIAVPDAALHRFPFLMGISSAIPGVAEKHPAETKRRQLGRQFAEVVEVVGREQGGNEYDGAHKQWICLLHKSGFFSKEAVAFRSLFYMKMKQDWVNDEWVEGLKWMGEHDEIEVLQFCLEN